MTEARETPPLVERLATSCVALRENTVYTADGQGVRLGVQADEMEEAAICIADMLEALKGAVEDLRMFYSARWSEFEGSEADLIGKPLAAIAKAEGRS